MSPEASASSNRWPEPQEWSLDPDVRVGLRERLAEIWRYRRILWFFAVSAIQGLYAKTKLGPFWLVIRPLAPILVGSLIYQRVTAVPSQGVPYFLFLLAGMTAWNFFDSPLLFASRALDGNRGLLTKLYLPRLILPVGQMAAGLVEPAICVVILLVTLVYYRATAGVWYASLSPRLGVAVLCVLVAMLLAFSISLWTSVWQARTRDAKFAMQYALGFWMLLTPIIYPSSYLSPVARRLMLLNPMAAPVEGFKWAVLGIGELPLTGLAASAAACLVALVLGVAYFTRVEAQTMDRL